MKNLTLKLLENSIYIAYNEWFSASITNFHI